MSTGMTSRDPQVVTCHLCGQDYHALYTHHTCPPFVLRERSLEEKVDLLISKVALLEVLVAKLHEGSA